MKCKFENCEKRAYYNYENETIMIYCNIHKLKNMKDLKNKKCVFENCNKIPNFNYIYEKTPIYCKIHKLDNMRDVKHKKCIFENCDILPTYNYDNTKTPIYCKIHKLDNMHDVINKRCIYNNCNSQPNYNYIYEKTPIYCKIHKLDNMHDVKHKKCIFENCNKNPCYNYKTETKAIYCNNHKLENMVDIVHKKCTSCNLFRVEKRNNFLCYYCNPVKSQKIKTKELSIKALLECNNIEFVHDKQITNECCLKYRPDFLIDCNSYYIVVEVDEDAHCSYDKECEIIRMNNISVSLGLPAKFIRYNPDKKGFSKKVKEETLIKILKEELKKEYLEDIEPIYLFY